MKTSYLTRLFKKLREGVAHVGFVRCQRFYPVPNAAEGDELLVTEIQVGSASWSGEYTVRQADGSTVRLFHSFSI